MATLVRKALELEGYSVDVAMTGTDAVWMGTENEYDAIVLDVMIPEPDGFEVCRRLRADGRWAPILLLTARDSVDDRVVVRAAPGPHPPGRAAASARPRGR